MDSIFEKPPKRHLKDLNLVPIIDMFTTVIFFLLLSTTFVALTKLTIPPTKVNTVTDPALLPPLAPKLFVVAEKENTKLEIRWAGRKPGMLSETIRPEDWVTTDSAPVIATIKKLLTEFTTKYPNETSIQIGLGPDLPYQKLITVMDGVRELIQNVVLISYEEAARTTQ